MQNLIPVNSKWSPRQVVLASLFVVSILVSLWLLYRFRTVVLLLFVAIMIGTGIKPAVGWLSKRGVTRVYGATLISLLFLVAFIAFLLLVMPMILEQATAISHQLSGYYESVRSFLLNSPSDILHRLGFKLSPQFQVDKLVKNSESGAGQQPQNVKETVDSVARTFQYAGFLARGIFGLIAVFLMAFYWTLEGDRAVRSLLLLIPTKKRDNVRAFVDAIEGKLGGYLIGQSLLNLSIGVFSLIAYLLIGLPNALVLAIFAGVMEAVPMIGPVLGALPAVLVTASNDPSKVIWVIVAAVIIQLLENNLLVPRIMDRSVGVHPVLTLLSLAAFTSLFGLAGALLAIPMAAIFQLLINRFVISPIQTELKPEGRDYLSYLRMQAQEISQDIRKQVGNKDQNTEQDEDQLEEAIETLANDLDRILSSIQSENPAT